MPARKELSELKLDIKSKYNGEYTYHSGEYINQYSPIKIKHVSGKIIETTFKNYREGKKLVLTERKSHSTKRLTVEIFEKRLVELNPDIVYLDRENFNGRKYPGKFQCRICDHSWSLKRVESVIESNSLRRTSCPSCSHKNRGEYLRDKKYLKNILKEAVDGDEYEWLDKYSFDNKKKYMILHKTCGNIYNAQAQGFKNGEQRCPYCFDSDSRHVRMIKSLLDSLNIDFEVEKTFDTCRNIYPLPFDFYIKSRNLLIEYDGSQHFRPWGSNEEIFNKLKINDNIKNEWSKENEIDLLRLNYKQSDNEIINTIKEKLL